MNVDFRTKQQEFSAYIRDPENNPPPPDVNPLRMAMYRELFFNNIDSFLSANFPVLRTLLDDRQWFELGQDFYAKHVCQTPYFSEIPEEFLDYLQNERDVSADFPFMLELAHYEWVEMALAISKALLPEDHQALDQLGRRIRLSPLAWPLAYQYPVHKISPAFLPETAPAQATFLLVYRDREDAVNFIEMTPVTYRLLQIIQEYEQAGDDASGRGIIAEDCLRQVAKESNHPNLELLMEGGMQILKDLVEKSVISIE